MKILVTGGSGFLGTNLVSYALEQGHEVLNFDSKPPMLRAHEGHWWGGSIERFTDVSGAYQDFQPEIVFHLAARTDLEGVTLDDYSANTNGVRNVIASASRLERKPHTIFASSRLVFAIDAKPQHTFDYSPSTIYGESKVESERIVMADAHSGGSWTIVRPTSIWGPWFGVPYRNFFDTVRAGRFVNIAGHDPVKSFGYVENSVYQLLRLALAERNLVDQQVFWLTDYEPVRVSQWATEIAKSFHVREPITVPLWTVKAAAKAGDIVKRVARIDPPITSFRLNNLITSMVYDASSTEAVVGELPFSVEEGVRRTTSWMMAR